VKSPNAVSFENKGQISWLGGQGRFPQLFTWACGARKAMKVVGRRFSTLAHPCGVNIPAVVANRKSLHGFLGPDQG